MVPMGVLETVDRQATGRQDHLTAGDRQPEAFKEAMNGRSELCVLAISGQPAARLGSTSYAPDIRVQPLLSCTSSC